MLSYVTHGDPESPAIVLLHGFLGSAADWDLVAYALSEGFFCVAPDLPGHGGSVGLPDGSYTMEGTARAIGGLMDDIGIQRATIAGYSMGGRLALYLALRHSERCASLFLESASPGIESEEERAVRRKADEERARRLEFGDFDEFLRDWYTQPLFASLARREGMVRELIESRKNNDPAELAKSLRGMGTGSQPSLWGELPGLRVPSILVAGQLDEEFVRVVHRMASLLHKTRVFTVPDVGHNLHLESPNEYTRLLRDTAGWWA